MKCFNHSSWSRVELQSESDGFGSYELQSESGGMVCRIGAICSRDQRVLPAQKSHENQEKLQLELGGMTFEIEGVAVGIGWIWWLRTAVGIGWDGV